MDYVIELAFDGPGFVAVPNHVVDMERLSAEALGVLVYLARLAGARSGAVVRVAAVRERFQMGKDRWQRIAGELREVRALTSGFGRSDDGKHIARFLRIGWPSAPVKSARKSVASVSRKTRLSEREVCGPENPAHRAGNPAEVGRVSRLLKEEQTTACAAAASSGEAAAQAGGVLLKKAKPFDLERARVSASCGLSWADPLGVMRKAADFAAFEASVDAENRRAGKAVGYA